MAHPTYNFNKTLDFIKSIVDGFTVGSNNVRFGMITFAKTVSSRFRLNSYSSRAAVKSAVGRTPFASGGSTNTHLGLKYAADTTLKTYYGARSNAVQMVVVITDGQSSNNTATLEQAKRLRDKGVIIFAVGVGSSIDRNELNAMASDPDSDHVFTVSSASAMDDIKETLQEKICSVVKEKVPPGGGVSRVNVSVFMVPIDILDVDDVRQVLTILH
nr:hypothetical protein BaRGS_016950 [Batillaria attramentaria]